MKLIVSNNQFTIEPTLSFKELKEQYSLGAITAQIDISYFAEATYVIRDGVLYAFFQEEYQTFEKWWEFDLKTRRWRSSGNPDYLR